MEQYLLELIKTNNRVIVPNFGAFIISRDNGTTVLFNNFLSFNDGLLINHVSNKEKIDTNEATTNVSNFVDKIKEELDKNGEYTIEKLGRFTKDSNGILRFIQDPKVSELLPDEKLSTAESEKDSALLDIDSSEQAEEPEKKQEKKSKKKEPTAPRASKGKDNNLLNLDTQSSPSKEKKPSEAKPPKPPSTKAAPPPPQKPEKDDYLKEEPDKSKFPKWIIALIVIILAAAIFLIVKLFFMPPNGQQEPLTPETPLIVDTTPDPTPDIDSIAIKKAEEEKLQREAAEKEKARQASIRKHHIIVGSFNKESNARQLVENLRAKGFENVTSFKHNNLTMVSATSFESLLKAREAQEKILQEHQLENWILTR